ncbi:MAG: DUF29 domain-containing protein [Beijerinckiaceae bacterium]|jgi:hypothetical protein
MDGMKEERGSSLYERDFYTWTQEQAGLLKSGQLDKVDLANLTEEIETLGRSELSALRSSYKLIAMHLLKMIKQPEMATASWEITINRERGNVEDVLDDNPGLKPKCHDIFKKAYASARRDAATETKMDVSLFPIEPPFSVDQVEDTSYWPPSFCR